VRYLHLAWEPCTRYTPLSPVSSLNNFWCAPRNRVQGWAKLGASAHYLHMRGTRRDNRGSRSPREGRAGSGDATITQIGGERWISDWRWPKKRVLTTPPPFPRHQSAAGVVFGHTQAPASKRRRQDTWEVKLAPKRKDKKREKRKKQRGTPLLHTQPCAGRTSPRSLAKTRHQLRRR